MKWQYEAHDRFAVTKVGLIEAESHSAAGEALRAQGLFVSQIIPDGAVMKTILKHDDVLGAGGINNADEPRGEDPIEKELFGDTQKVDDFGTLEGKESSVENLALKEMFQEAVQPPSVVPVVDWVGNLATDLESLGDVLKLIHQWRNDYAAHQTNKEHPLPPLTIGGKSWEVIDAALPEAHKEIVTEILRKAVFRTRN